MFGRSQNINVKVVHNDQVLHANSDSLKEVLAGQEKQQPFTKHVGDRETERSMLPNKFE
ncbi:hypothetical protein HK102_002898, partial [Quaeritorhiza haematococci]